MRCVEPESCDLARPIMAGVAPVLVVAAVVLGTVGIGAASMAMPVAVAVAAGGVVVVMVLWRRPRVALVVWLLSVAMLPVWIGVSWSAYIPIQSVIAIAAIIANIGNGEFRINKFDLYFGTFMVIALAAVMLAGSNQGIWTEFVVLWGLSYLVARVLISSTAIPFAINTVAIIFAVVGGLALIELLLTWHPYVEWNVASLEYEAWGEIQTRAGLDRSEWAFGHSIALGGSVALSIPFILGSSFGRSLKVLMLALAFAGIIASASRAALIAGVFTLLLCSLAYFAMRSARVTIFVIATGAAIFVPDYLNKFALGVTDEEQHSANYRGQLYQTLIGELPSFGKSDIVTFTSSGVRIARLESVDSSFLYVGLNFGWVIVAMLLIPLALSAIRLMVGTASMAEVAVLGQIPLLATVALITQYQSFLFFVAGFAVQLAFAAKTAGVVRLAPAATTRERHPSERTAVS